MQSVCCIVPYVEGWKNPFEFVQLLELKKATEITDQFHFSLWEETEPQRWERRFHGYRIQAGRASTAERSSEGSLAGVVWVLESWHRAAPTRGKGAFFYLASNGDCSSLHGQQGCVCPEGVPFSNSLKTLYVSEAAQAEKPNFLTPSLGLFICVT